MKRYVLSEHLKTRRTTLRKMMVFIPFLCALVACGFNSMGGPEVTKWTLVTILNQWALMWMPALIALLTGLRHSHEQKSTGYKTIYSFPIDLRASWLSKMLLMSVYSFFATALLGLMIGLLSLMQSYETGLQVSLLDIYAALALCWVLTLWQIPFYSWLVRKVNFFILIIVNCALSIGLGALPAPYKLWWLSPWSWPLRMEAPLLQLHPNGIPLKVGSPLLDGSVIPIAIALSLLLFGLMLPLTSRAFQHREVL